MSNQHEVVGLLAEVLQLLLSFAELSLGGCKLLGMLATLTR